MDHEYIPGTCELLFKYKYAHLNSVDFRLKVVLVQHILLCVSGCVGCVGAPLGSLLVLGASAMRLQ
jgi:hypothetical protein